MCDTSMQCLTMRQVVGVMSKEVERMIQLIFMRLHGPVRPVGFTELEFGRMITENLRHAIKTGTVPDPAPLNDFKASLLRRGGFNTVLKRTNHPTEENLLDLAAMLYTYQILAPHIVAGYDFRGALGLAEAEGRNEPRWDAVLQAAAELVEDPGQLSQRLNEMAQAHGRPLRVSFTRADLWIIMRVMRNVNLTVALLKESYGMDIAILDRVNDPPMEMPVEQGEEVGAGPSGYPSWL